MDHNFWIKKWESTEQGFQQQNINSRLIKFWNVLGITHGKTFVPLCGSSIDMIWLKNSGHHVIGNELSEIACKHFFKTHNIDFAQISQPPFERYIGDDIEILQGDFFAITKTHLKDVKTVYDRAAIIALPSKMRIDYVNHLSKILEKGCLIFLISMDYDEGKMKGPPFSVNELEIRNLFSNNFEIEIITQSSGPDILGNLSKRGLDTLNEKVYKITKL